MREAKLLFNNLVKQLQPTYDDEEARSIVFILLQHVLNLKKTDVLANRSLPPTFQADSLQAAMHRLIKHEPIQYVVGETDFYGRRFWVNPAVLIPRPETEELVHRIVERYRLATQPIRMLDIGTGSGCIAVTLATELPQANVSAWDISEAALTVARKNADLHGVSVHFSKVDILQPHTWEHEHNFDCIVSNPPYVMRGEMPKMRPNVTDYEPHLALFVEDESPLVFYESIATFCQRHLSADGQCYIEINEQYGQEVQRLFERKGFTDTEIHRDLFDKERFVRARRG
jgi:release factor glutamine methyltransferase